MFVNSMVEILMELQMTDKKENVLKIISGNISQIKRGDEELVLEMALGIKRYDEINKIFVDLDYDLGNYDFTGYTISEYIVNNKIPLAGAVSHSLGVFYRKKIEDLFLQHDYHILRFRSEVIE